MNECYDLLSQVEIVFGQNYEIECPLIPETIQKINNKIKIGKGKIRELNAAKVKILQDDDEFRENVKLQDRHTELMFSAESLEKEIKLRCETLTLKCDLSVFDSVSDYQVLELKKNLGSLDIELREIFQKISEFSKIASQCGDEKDKMLMIPLNHQEKTLAARNAFAKTLHSVFTERDISEEKLKHASVLTIDLPKFKGYDSKLDIYTFKSEFEKLVQPTTLKRLWVEVLKKNYLIGPAFTLVDQIQEIEEVWKKLIDAYGNVRLLLQNKLSCLDKHENLNKVKGDENLANAIAKILNMMTDLSNLAEKHNLQNKLYIGGGLEKVLSLLGEERERRFLTKTYEWSKKRERAANSPTAAPQAMSELTKEKMVWVDLQDFLKRELALCENLALVKKSRMFGNCTTQRKPTTPAQSKSCTRGNKSNSLSHMWWM